LISTAGNDVTGVPSALILPNPASRRNSYLIPTERATECVLNFLCFVCLAASFRSVPFRSVPFHSVYTYSTALWIVEGLALVLGAPLRLRASPAAGEGVHELGIVDGLLDAALQMLAVFAVVLLLPVRFSRGLAAEASRVVDARGCLVEERIVRPTADAAGRTEGRRGW